MSPEKKKIINGYLVEEYWWAGKLVVYIDHHATEETYDEACNRLETETAPNGGEG